MSGSGDSAEPGPRVPCATAQSQRARPARFGGRARGLVTSVLLVAVLGLSGCASTRVLRPFTTDGCSLFPDAADWSGCCETHDLAYWRGGSAAERRRADAELRACVLAHTGRPLLAGLMYRGVRIGGMPLVPSPFRWAYGWGYGRGYASLSEAEQRRVEEQLRIDSLARPQTSCSRESE